MLDESTVPGAGLPRILTLDTPIREYAWGSVTAIPAMLGIPATGRPAAELWMGAHPDNPSRWAADPDRPGLDALISADPQSLLGAETVAAFGPRLPFLLKVLAADKSLSMQVHPNLAQAQAGYAAEEQRGLAHDSPERNYTDPNHKPELLCALTPFKALCGFRPVADTVRLLDALVAVGVDELQPYRNLLAGEDGVRATFTTVLTLPERAQRALTERVLRGCQVLAEHGGEFSAAAGASQLAAADFPQDVGAVLALLLNYVELQPGEAIFLGAGNVHAYLRGVGVELLANSDNVLRCGLTPKHLDIPELLRVADFHPLADPYARPVVLSRYEKLFQVGVTDFSLTVVTPAGSAVDLDPDLAALVLCADGEISIVTRDPVEQAPVTLSPGRAVFVRVGDQAVQVSGSGTAFVAQPGLADPGR
jgi:mannose-6-phosphate isomerase